MNLMMHLCTIWSLILRPNMSIQVRSVSSSDIESYSRNELEKMTPHLSNYWTIESFFRLTYTLHILYVTCDPDSYDPYSYHHASSYKLEKLASSDDGYEVPFKNILGRTFYILYVTRTHEPCSHELEQLASIDDTQFDSNIYLVPRCNTRALLLVYIKHTMYSLCPQNMQFLFFEKSNSLNFD
jgi:hypothetical protein